MSNIQLLCNTIAKFKIHLLLFVLMLLVMRVIGLYFLNNGSYIESLLPKHLGLDTV